MSNFNDIRKEIFDGAVAMNRVIAAQINLNNAVERGTKMDSIDIEYDFYCDGLGAMLPVKVQVYIEDLKTYDVFVYCSGKDITEYFSYEDIEKFRARAMEDKVSADIDHAFDRHRDREMEI